MASHTLDERPEINELDGQVEKKHMYSAVEDDLWALGNLVLGVVEKPSNIIVRCPLSKGTYESPCFRACSS
jgi:hypothetical protein